MDKLIVFFCRLHQGAFLCILSLMKGLYGTDASSPLSHTLLQLSPFRKLKAKTLTAGYRPLSTCTNLAEKWKVPFKNKTKKWGRKKKTHLGKPAKTLAIMPLSANTTKEKAASWRWAAWCSFNISKGPHLSLLIAEKMALHKLLLTLPTEWQNLLLCTAH